MDDAVRNSGLAGTEHGLLGLHGGGRADRGYDECPLLEHEASKERERRGETCLISQQEFFSLAQRTVADEAVLRKLSIMCKESSQ